jgi:hypothetical protein
MSIPNSDLQVLDRERERVAAAHRERMKAAGVDGSLAGSVVNPDPAQGLRKVAPGGLDGGPLEPGQYDPNRSTGAAAPTHSTAPYQKPEAAQAAQEPRHAADGPANRLQAATEPQGGPQAPYRPDPVPIDSRRPGFGGQGAYTPMVMAAEPEVDPETGRAKVPEDESLQEFYTFHFIGPEIRVDLGLPEYLGLGPVLAVVIPPITTLDQDDMEVLSMRYSKLSNQVHSTEDPHQRKRYQQRRLALQEEMAARFMPVFKDYPGLFFRMGNDAFNFLWDIVQRMSRGATNAAALAAARRAAQEGGTIRPNS